MFNLDISLSLSLSLFSSNQPTNHELKVLVLSLSFKSFHLARLVTQYSLTLGQVLGDSSAILTLLPILTSLEDKTSRAVIKPEACQPSFIPKAHFDLADLSILRLNVDSLEFNIRRSLAAALITKDHLQP